MKLLLCAHPDDEVLWFNPDDFDKIVIVFGRRKDKPTVWNNKRIEAVKNHPLKDKITFLNLEESNFWRDATCEDDYQKNFVDLCLALEKFKPDSVTTHNANGEYGHLDHKLCFMACMQVFDCLVNGISPIRYRQIKEHYKHYDSWTWI